MISTLPNHAKELIPSRPRDTQLDPEDKYIIGGNFPDSEKMENDKGVEEDLCHSKKHGYYLCRNDSGTTDFRKMSRADIMRWQVDRFMIKNMGIRKEFHALMDAAGIGGNRITTAR